MADSVLINKLNAQSIVDAFHAKQLALLKAKANPNNSKPDNPSDWNKAAPRNVRSLKQTTTDVVADSTQTARPIGDLTGGKTRLNIFGALTANDKVDFFSFNLKTTGKVGASLQSDAGVRVQLLRANGTIVADSAATFGEKKQNWEDLQATRLYMDKGQYFLKVTRANGVLDSVKPNYAVQLSMGKYITEDYDTVDTPATSATAGVLAPKTASAASILSILNGTDTGNIFDFLT